MRQITALPATDALAARIAQALDATSEQRDLCPDAPEPPRVAAFAQALVGRREQALTSPEPLLPLFAQALAAAADDEARQALCVARAGLVSHGLALAHTHVRLNAAQIHNVVRQRLGIADRAGGPRASPRAVRRDQRGAGRGEAGRRWISARCWPSRPRRSG